MKFGGRSPPLPDAEWIRALATLLSETVWPSEVVRRLRPAAQSFDVHIIRPN